MSESLSSPFMSSSHSAPGVTTPRVAIAGGGVIGLAIGWQLAQAGCAVEIFDAGTPGRGASHAAAGMLAACAEAEPGEETLLDLNRESQRLWPAFADALEAASGLDVGYKETGTLVVALTADDAGKLRHQHAFQKKLDLPVEWLNAAEARRREPHLADRISGALWCPQDHQADNRAVTTALLAACAKAGVRVHADAPVARVVTHAGKARGVEVMGELHEADVVVLAAGAWSRSVDITPARPLPVRPIKGQMLALQMDPAAPLLRHVVWGPGIYLVPRADGRLILGATVEEKGFDETLTAGGQLALLTHAWRAVPTIEELPILEQWVGFRPGSRDDAPILGPSEVDGLIYATGHHRNGILLLPVTTKAIVDLILSGESHPLAAAFGAERFQPRAAAE
ncbi:glycine oxidase ThiO [Aquabacter cavernae]|uniref:glycine oxidase ThiO n=1 Tax=Aquabacter cavernae TaxID=2496029 RepID=UPI000F8E5DE0|nr:glycine oxidase ThiO [Aquabacter cavernae]